MDDLTNADGLDKMYERTLEAIARDILERHGNDEWTPAGASDESGRLFRIDAGPELADVLDSIIDSEDIHTWDAPTALLWTPTTDHEAFATPADAKEAGTESLLSFSVKQVVSRDDSQGPPVRPLHPDEAPYGDKWWSVRATTPGFKDAWGIAYFGQVWVGVKGEGPWAGVMGEDAKGEAHMVSIMTRSGYGLLAVQPRGTDEVTVTCNRLDDPGFDKDGIQIKGDFPNTMAAMLGLEVDTPLPEDLYLRLVLTFFFANLALRAGREPLPPAFLFGQATGEHDTGHDGPQQPYGEDMTAVVGDFLARAGFDPDDPVFNHLEALANAADDFSHWTAGVVSAWFFQLGILRALQEPLEAGMTPRAFVRSAFLNLGLPESWAENLARGLPDEVRDAYDWSAPALVGRPWVKVLDGFGFAGALNVSCCRYKEAIKAFHALGPLAYVLFTAGCANSGTELPGFPDSAELFPSALEQAVMPTELFGFDPNQPLGEGSEFTDVLTHFIMSHRGHNTATLFPGLGTIEDYKIEMRAFSGVCDDLVKDSPQAATAAEVLDVARAWWNNAGPLPDGFESPNPFDPPNGAWGATPSRNDQCPCLSGTKFKNCHGAAR